MDKIIAKIDQKIHPSSKKPKKSLGQHFLKNKIIIDTIINSLIINNTDLFIEIGPGKGALTIPFLKKCVEKNVPISYIGIEKDEMIAKTLREKIQIFSNNLLKLNIIEGDILKFLPSQLDIKKKSIILFGNIPYYLTGKLFRILWNTSVPPEKIIFMIQEEVGKRIVGKKMNKLKAFIEFWGIPSIIMAVSKKNFSPPPKVNSIILSINKRNGEIYEKSFKETYEKLVRTIYAQPRKTLENNLKLLFSSDKKNAKIMAQHLIKKMEIKKDIRPEKLTYEMLISMTHIMYNKRNGAQKK